MIVFKKSLKIPKGTGGKLILVTGVTTTTTKWNAGARALSSIKTPTCLLLDKEKKFVAFGYEAENQYADLVMESKQKQENYIYPASMCVI
jgi:hypothetical protein